MTFEQYLTSALQELNAYYEAEQHAAYSTEQKLFGWILTSTNPSVEWEIVKTVDPAKVTVFGRKALETLRSVMESGRSDFMKIQFAFSGYTKDKVYALWLHKCLSAGIVYAITPPTKTELKEICV
jgi:hypothetical protein